MGFVNQSFERLIERAVSDLSKTQLTALNDKSNIRKLLDPALARLRDQSLEFNRNLTSPLLSGATGDFLNLVGETRGIVRGDPEKANINAVDRNLKFTTLSTFGAINGGQDIEINPGVLISSDKNFGEGSPNFSLKESVTLPASEREVYVSAEALNLGDEYNIEAKFDSNAYLSDDSKYLIGLISDNESMSLLPAKLSIQITMVR